MLTSDYGKIVKIDHGSGLETRYAHTSLIVVKVGDRVEKGQLIARVGNTGRSTGAHLHFEIRLNGAPLDLRKYLQGYANKADASQSGLMNRISSESYT